jgi:hypothetical protein
MINRYLSFIVFLSVLVLHACKNKETTQSYCEQNPDGCQSISEAKDFFAFKLGSWWVYEEENTLQRDSMYVIESSINPNGYEFDIRIQSDLTGYRYHYWPEYYPNIQGCNNDKLINSRCLYVKVSKGKAQDYKGEKTCMFITYRKDLKDIFVSGNALCPTSELRISDVYTTFTNKNLKFKKTINFEDNCDILEGNQFSYHYYSRNIGLIKRELVDSNQVWNLVNYHIQE